MGNLETDALALSEAQIGIAVDSDGNTDSTAAGLHLRNSGMAEVLQVILLSKRARAANTQKIVSIFATAIILIGLVVVLVSPK